MKVSTQLEKVLLMDDEKAVREVAAEILRFLGFEVSLARDGEEALEKYVNEIKQSGRPFDIVIVDLSIPTGMNGSQCAIELKKIDPNAHILLSSGNLNGPVAEHYRDYGFQGLIQKPFEIETLSKAILGVTH